MVADRAQKLLGLGRAQPALSAPAAPSPPTRRAAPPTPAGRRLVLAATAVLDGELEVPFRRAVVRPQQQGFAVRALGAGPCRVPAAPVVSPLPHTQPPPF